MFEKIMKVEEQFHYWLWERCYLTKAKMRGEDLHFVETVLGIKLYTNDGYEVLHFNNVFHNKVFLRQFVHSRYAAMFNKNGCYINGKNIKCKIKDKILVLGESSCLIPEDILSYQILTLEVQGINVMSEIFTGDSYTLKTIINKLEVYL